MKDIGKRNNMEEWKEYKLGDVSSVSSSKRIFADEYQSEGIPFYRSKEIIEKQKGISIANELYIKESRYNEIKNKFGVPQKGDILLTSVGTLGIPYLVKDEIFYFKDGNITWFYNFKGINNRYLYYWFLSPIAKHYFDIKAIGSTQKALTIETLKKFDIVLPSKSIQQKVADVLKSFDDKIELNNRINANLEEQAQALFRRWFVDFEFPNEQGLPYKSNGGTFVDSELGKIPDGWKVGNLFSVATLFDSKRKPLSNIQRASRKGEYPYYGATSVMDYVDDYLFDGTFLLMGEDGSVVNEQGYPFLQYVTGKFWVNNHAHIMQGKNGFSTEMLYCMMKMTNISNLVTGAVQAKLSQTNMNKILFPLATKDILKYFSIMIEPLYALLRKNVYENQTLIQLRDLLLPKLMSGETIWSINY